MWLLSYRATNKFATCDRIVIFWHSEISEWITCLLRGTCLTRESLSPAFMWVHKEEIPKIQLQILDPKFVCRARTKRWVAAGALWFFFFFFCPIPLQCFFVLFCPPAISLFVDSASLSLSTNSFLTHVFLISLLSLPTPDVFQLPFYSSSRFT